jgi:chromosome segregation ATPase
MNKDETAGLAAMVNWLEAEQQEGKSHLNKLQQQTDRILKMLQEQALRLQSVEELADSLKSRAHKLPALEEDLRQVKERLGGLQETTGEQGKALEKLERQRKSGEEASHQALLHFSQELERLGEGLQKLAERTGILEGALKRSQEQADWLRGGLEELQRSSEATQHACSLSQEQSRRVQEKADQLGLEMDTLRRQDELLQSKLDTLGHQLSQLDERVAYLNGEEQNRKDWRDRLELQKVGLERLEKQLLQAHQFIDKHSEALERQAQELREMESKRTKLAEQVLRLQQEAKERQAHLEDLITELGDIQEQHKRRQIGELEHEIRDLKQRLARLKGLERLAAESKG